MKSEVFVALGIVAVLVITWRAIAWLMHRGDAPRKSQSQLRIERERREAAMRSHFNPAELRRLGIENAEIERLKQIRIKAERDYQIAVAKAIALGEPAPPRPPSGKQ